MANSLDKIKPGNVAIEFEIPHKTPEWRPPISLMFTIKPAPVHIPLNNNFKIIIYEANLFIEPNFFLLLVLKLLVNSINFIYKDPMPMVKSATAK